MSVSEKRGDVVYTPDWVALDKIRCYGTGGRLGFPMGNAVGAMHIVRNHVGGTWITHYDTDIVLPSEDGLYEVTRKIDE